MFRKETLSLQWICLWSRWKQKSVGIQGNNLLYTVECRYNAVLYEKILHIIAGTDAEDQSESEPQKDT